jgi:hypothetical protein
VHQWRLLGFFAALLSAATICGQVNTATVYGNVSDPSGGAVPQAQNTRLYLNAAAFQLVPTLSGNPIAPGNIGRDAVPGPGLWTVALSLSKSFNVTERLRMQFRADAFNLFNHPNPSNIVANLSQGSFGTINTLGFRTMQIGARFSF